MDFIEQSGVKLTKSVLVKGDKNTAETDQKLFDCLRKYGAIEKVVPVDDPLSTEYKNLIVEFKDESAISALEPLLPLVHNMEDEGVGYQINSLAHHYAATVGGIHTEKYLKQISEIATSSGRSFEELLKDMLSHMSKELKKPSKEEEEEEEEEDSPAFKEEADESPSLKENTRRVTRTVSLSGADLNPPDIQRVVVEHILKKEDFSSHSLSPIRLRTFSGNFPKPNNEIDYETWRSQAELLLADPSLSALHVTRRILDSLLSPAADVVKGLGPEARPTTYLQVLDAAFATVQDGEELFAQFLTTYQAQDEKYSAYLQRLQLTLNSVLKRGGIQASEAEKHLIRQFCRGCLENPVITNLLDKKKDNPPSFSELLLLLRTEEDRQLAKESRMKKHANTTKQRVHLSSHSACDACGATSEPALSAINDLKKQMNDLQSQLSSLLAQKKSHPMSSKSKDAATAVPSPSTKPKPWYCFKCGEDGHISASCSNAANPSLVMTKKKQLQQKQQNWEKKNTSN